MQVELTLQAAAGSLPALLFSTALVTASIKGKSAIKHIIKQNAAKSAASRDHSSKHGSF